MMKWKGLKGLTIINILLLALTLLSTSNSFSQGVAINSTGAIADSSAGLDIQFNNMGILIPRLTTAERNAISSPAEGLLIYNKTIKCFEFFDYGLWQTGKCAVCPLPAISGSISGSSAVCLGQNTVSYSVPPIANATTYIWAYSGLGATIYGSNNSITIDFSGLATSGDITVTGINNCGSGPISADFPVNINALPPAPLAGIHNPFQTEIIWNWNSVPGATGYKYNTTNDYNSAIDNGTNTSYIQTGLICNDSYTLYVWAYNVCGNSYETTLTQNTLSCLFLCGIGTVSFTYNTSNVTFGTIAGNNGTCWLDRNLGASQVATGANDVAAYGDLFQWGRGDDGHQLRNSNCTSNISNIVQPGHSYFITAGASTNYDWLNPNNNFLWQGVNGINNPCPSGWRIPSETEIVAESTNYGALKFTQAGYRTEGGTLWDVGYNGYYRTSNIAGAYARVWALNQVNMYSYYRAYGMSVRCIKDY